MLEARTQAGSGLQGGSGNRGSRTVRQANRNKAREDVWGETPLSTMMLEASVEERIVFITGRGGI